MRSPHYSWRAQKVKDIVQSKPKKKRKPMRKGYWKAYDQATKQSLKKLYESCLQVCKELGPPWKTAKTGRPPTMTPEEHAALHILRRRVGKASRFIEQLSPCVTGKNIDHSWHCRTLQRIPLDYIDKAIALVYEKTTKLVKWLKTVFLSDSTGISTDRKHLVIVKDKPTRKTIVDKQHIIARYTPAKSIVSIARSKPTREQRNDSPVLREQLDFQGNGEDFFADKAYDGRVNREFLKKHGFNPIIKYRERETTRREKPRKLTGQESKKYKRYRGLIETPFGGSEIEYGNKTCFRLKEQRYKDNKLLSLVHNIKSYLRLLAEVRAT